MTTCAGVDVIFDPVGGSLLMESLKTARWGAHVLIIGFASGGLLLVIVGFASGGLLTSYRRLRLRWAAECIRARAQLCPGKLPSALARLARMPPGAANMAGCRRCFLVLQQRNPHYAMDCHPLYRHHP